VALRLRLDKPWRPLTAEVVDRLPGQLGVYQIADAKGTIVYIGQAGARTAFGLRSELQREASQRASGHQFRVEVNQQYRTLFTLWYTYGPDGRPTWFVMPNGSWTAANTWSAPVYRANGAAWVGVPYDASRHSLVPVGTMTFTFPDAQNAAMSYTIDGVSGSNALTRLPF